MEMPDKHIIDRVLKNIASKEEAKEVVRWFATPEGRDYLDRLIAEDERNIQPGMEEHYIDITIPSAEMYDHIMSKVRWQHRKRILFRVAAILIPFILIIGQFWYLNRNVDLLGDAEINEIYVPKGERTLIVFQDGTKAYLNSESRIKYPCKFTLLERKVFLEGEAFFEVSSNRKRPFIVDLNGLEIKVLGTTFDVKAYPEDHEVYVVLETGSVSISSFSHQIAHLNPGEKAVYNRKTNTCKISRPANLTSKSAWRKNLIVFENTPLEEVIQVLSRWYDVDFIIEDTSVYRYSYTLTSSKKQIHQILEELEKISPVRFIDHEGKIQVVMKK